MKYTKIVAMLALAVSFRAFAVDSTKEKPIKKIKINVANNSDNEVGLSVEGTENGTPRGKKVIFSHTTLPAHSINLLTINYNPDYLIPVRNDRLNIPIQKSGTNEVEKDTMFNTYKFKIKHLLPNEIFNPEDSKQLYSQATVFQPISNPNLLPVVSEDIDIVLVIPPIGQPLEKTTRVSLFRRAFTI